MSIKSVDCWIHTYDVGADLASSNSVHLNHLVGIVRIGVRMAEDCSVVYGRVRT
jgi:hypothetical protein